MPSKLRLERIADRIRQELSEMIVMGDIQDPRLSGISITDVRVDRELAYADIFVSSYEGSERSKEIIWGLRSATGFIRKNLAERLDLRVFPKLRFHWDPTPEKADRIEALLKTIHEEEAQAVPDEVEEEDGDESAE